ncbi:hypothetical protein [Streptomyces chrestomyceticus]|uniref:hypothetical protein n=1 Tax=Streptomyces chrestomyceticus TaxID=68185 RepID=UPI003406B3BF
MSSDGPRAEQVLAELLALIEASSTLTASEVERLSYRGGDGLRVVFDVQPADASGPEGPQASVRVEREPRPRRERRPRALGERQRRALEGPP